MSLQVVVTGATGNVGTSVIQSLAEDERVGEIVGIARRRPSWRAPKTRWVQADVARDPLDFTGADVVIHLAWLIQPSRDDEELRKVNGVLDRHPRRHDVGFDGSPRSQEGR